MRRTQHTSRIHLQRVPLLRSRAYHVTLRLRFLRSQWLRSAPSPWPHAIVGIALVECVAPALEFLIGRELLAGTLPPVDVVADGSSASCVYWMCGSGKRRSRLVYQLAHRQYQEIVSTRGNGF